MARAPKKKSTTTDADQSTTDYRHDDKRTNIPPAQIASEGKAPRVKRAKYHYSPHLPPELRFDPTTNADKVLALANIAAQRALNADELKLLREALKAQQPWLEWATKQEQHDQKVFDVDPVVLHIHERVSAQAIVRIAARQDVQRDLFADPKQPYQQAVQFYRHEMDWANRLILGDSLQVMSSLAKRENLGGKVQTIFIDPPYGIRFASNFQPVVGKREVGDGDGDLTREIEMVRAFRDTWTLGVHSYLSYLRQRLIVARELLTPSGSIFMQIGDENVHRVRDVLDDVFGPECHVVTILIKKKGAQKSTMIDPVNDYLLWYSRTPRSEKPPLGSAETSAVKFRAIYEKRELDSETLDEFSKVELPDGRTFPLRACPAPDGEVTDYRLRPQQVFKDYPGTRLFRPWPITNGGTRANQIQPISLGGVTYTPPQNNCWRHTSQAPDGSLPGMEKIKIAGRLLGGAKAIDFKRYLDDFPYKLLSNWWDGLGGASNPVYVVQTNEEIVKRCILMTSDPGDLVLDPTCGSGTTAFVAEQWGRRWITIDTSRVAIAIARARVLCATYPNYLLMDSHEGHQREAEVSGDAIADTGEPRRNLRKGFVYERARRITSGEFANNPDIQTGMDSATIEELVRQRAPAVLLVDRPFESRGTVRVSGPFTVEGVNPEELSLGEEGLFDGTPKEFEPSGDDAPTDDRLDNVAAYLTEMVRLLKADGLTFTGAKTPKKLARLDSLFSQGTGTELHAEGIWEGVSDDEANNIAITFGPQYGPVTAMQVENAIRAARRYDELVIAGFSFAPEATAAIEDSRHPKLRIHQAQIRPDINPGMAGLLKDTPNSQLFTVFGQPEIDLKETRDGWVVTLEGVDLYDPVNNVVRSSKADKVAAWFLDSDFDGRCFCVTQAFFPNQKAWEKIAKALKTQADASIFEKLAGTVSLPFPAGTHKRIAVKVIDPRGNEVMAIRKLGK